MKNDDVMKQIFGSPGMRKVLKERLGGSEPNWHSEAANFLSLVLTITTAQIAVYTFARQELAMGTEQEKIELMTKEILRGALNSWYRGASEGLGVWLAIQKLEREANGGAGAMPWLDEILERRPEDFERKFLGACKQVLKEVAPQIFDLTTITEKLPKVAEIIKDMPSPNEGEEWKRGGDEPA